MDLQQLKMGFAEQIPVRLEWFFHQDYVDAHQVHTKVAVLAVKNA